MGDGGGEVEVVMMTRETKVFDGRRIGGDRNSENDKVNGDTMWDC